MIALQTGLFLLACLGLAALVHRLPRARPMGWREPALAAGAMILGSVGGTALLLGGRGLGQGALALGPLVGGAALGGIASAAVALARVPLDELGLRWGRPRDLLWGLACLAPLGGFTAAYGALLDGLGSPPEDQAFLTLILGAWGTPLGVFACAWAALGAPLTEELLFRGLLLPPAARLLGVPGGLVFSAALFGAMHAADPWAVPPLVVLGLALGALRIRAGTLAPCVALHLANNVLTLALAGASLRP